MDKRTAVILMNLGGPLALQDVRPFLYNLFSDPAIINLPTVFRKPLAWLISKRREKTAQEIYQYIGGKSPLLENTQEQARLLEEKLSKQGKYKTFIAMRYWHPLTNEVIQQVKEYAPDEIVLLPLYPQFSTTTSQSSIDEWKKQAIKTSLRDTPTRALGCYPQNAGFADAQANLVQEKLKALPKGAPFRLLFSAHGLPQKIVDAGDPYELQVNQTVKAVMEKLPGKIDYKVCFQSKVGPLKWLSPSIDEELKQAADDNVGVIVVPIAFVSEHSETLVELDIEYRKISEELNIPFYIRVGTVSNHPDFISGLENIILETGQRDNTTCLEGFSKCYCAKYGGS